MRMLSTISRTAWRLSLILRPFGFRPPGSLKIGEFNSLCEVEHAPTLAEHTGDSFEESQADVLHSLAKKKR